MLRKVKIINSSLKKIFRVFNLYMNIPKIKFSYDFSRGSCSHRNLKMEQINKKLFQGIMNLYEETDSVRLRDIEKQCKKDMPEPIYFKIRKVKPDEQNSCAGTMMAEFLNSKLVGYKILIESSNKLNLSKLPILMHEITHLLDMVLNPKTINAEEKLLKMDLGKVFEDLYDKYYWTPFEFPEDIKKHLEITKSYTKEKLKYLNTDDKIILLNNIKQNIITEINALKEEEKYAQVLQLIGEKADKSSLSTKEERTVFESELKLVNKTLYDVISNERYHLALQQSPNSITSLKIKIMHILKDIVNG